MILGLVSFSIGIVSFFYVEKIRKKRGRIDQLCTKGYIGAITLIISGFYLFIIEFIKII